MTLARTCFVALLFGCFVFASRLDATENTPAAAPEQVEFFERNVRPVLVQHCVDCHGPEVQEAGLRLDRRDLLMRGIDGHPIVVPGQPEKSRLMAVVRYDGDVQMPPDGKLAGEQLAALDAWIKMGLPWPSDTAGPEGGDHALPAGSAAERIASTRAEHWSLQPLARAATPAVSDSAWCASPIDSFILARLEAAQLAPSPPADRRTLIRRAYFDLIGLPPTAEQVQAFVDDPSPDAFATVVDRLLASPQYGQRWGRHWLDVARYSDTKGYVLQQERRYPFAYTYRDWVIDAFNADLPFNQFVRQQLAADLLPERDPDDPRPLAALGFITVGRRYSRAQDTIDDRIDVVTRGLLGLTVSCARCHDHKYDPIPTEDYYSLYGIFANSIEPELPPPLSGADDSPEYQEYLAQRSQLEAEAEQYVVELYDSISDSVRGTIDQYLLAATRVRLGQPAGSGTSADGKPVELRSQMVSRWNETLSRNGPKPLFAPWRELVAIPADTFAQQAPQALERLLASARADARQPLNPLVSEALANAELREPLDVARAYGELFLSIDQQWRTLRAEAEQAGQPAPEQFDDAPREEIRRVLWEQTYLARLPRADFERYFSRAERTKYRDARKKVDQLDVTSPGAPPRPMTLVDVEKPADKAVLIRGNPGRPGPVVPRRFLQMLCEGSPEPFTQGSGRLQLAEAIVDPANPLTARVIANRVWMHHFGAPLVATPSDFGVRSDPPSHPELLDWLAATLIDDGWSLKRLHRRIMLSSAYRQASNDRPDCAAVDPENRLLWRMNRRRLELEPMRDAMLAVAGSLEPRHGGRPVDLWKAPYTGRRTVYGYIDRQDLPSVFGVFDFASPDVSTEQRPRTTVPQQALFAMNSPFVIDMARRLANRPEVAGTADPAHRAEQLYRLALQRDPRPDEVDLAVRFVASAAALAAAVPAWQYGYGEFDADDRVLGAFTALPHFTGDAWQGSDKWPDPKLGYVRLSATGGHPGSGKLASVLRWTAPAAMQVEVTGRLAHPRAEGDGVRASVRSSRGGVLHTWLAHHQHVDTRLDRIEVQAGDVLDFIVDCRTGNAHDSFEWSPIVRRLDAEPLVVWNSRLDFQGPPPPSLDAWEMLAQVLLLTNEFLFVD